MTYYTWATVIPVSSVVKRDDDTIFTWYKFTVTSVLSKATQGLSCPPPPIDPPVEFLPLAQNEIAVPFTGGTATADGMSITMRAQEFWRPLELGQMYLLFFRASPNPKVAGGREPLEGRVFKVDKNGLLTSVSRFSPLSQVVPEKGTIAKLRAYVHTHAVLPGQP